ncbi:cell division protein ZapA [Salidesulfovibrio onnuriiensis]|uniref:cell division protein ZapA n=1 Tax=Salidesulfovibrio onnuriiensis TaxID=2583823 RepID=UPI0011CBC225|nr:cell division protein ZapA [Salidesulfovibrio onnuriiensis]
MPRYTLSLMGLEISFKTDATADRVEAARQLLEERYTDLNENAGDLSKERLLTFLALSLADDYLVNQYKLSALEEKIGKILEKAP